MRTVLLGFVLALSGLPALPAPAVPAEPPAGFPDPARLEGEIAAFEKADRESPPPAGAVVCLGSSSIRMWHEHLAADLAPITVVPRGFGGSTMADALLALPRIVLGLRPRAILLYEGDNDIEAGVTPEAVEAVFGALRDSVETALPGTRFYVLAIKPSPSRWAVWPKMQEANDLLARDCDADSLLTYIDIATPMLGENGRPRPGIFLPDSLHMNREGYAIWRSAIRPVLLEHEARWEPKAKPAGRRN